MSEPVRLGIIGCGGISFEHGNAARNIPQKVRFVACCDIRQALADKWAAQYGAEHAYTDHEQMLRQEKLDGVVIATWPHQHRAHIEACLDAGVKNVLCEKALTITGEDAVALWQRVRAENAFLMEGFMYRHHPCARRLEHWVNCGEIGQVDCVRATFDAYDSETGDKNNPNRDWRQKKELTGGVPYDFTPYPVNACGHFSQGIPVRVFTMGYTGHYETINRLFALIEYDNACVGMVRTSRKGNLDEELFVSGSTGYYRIPLTWNDVGHVAVEKTHMTNWPYVLTDHLVVQTANAYQLQLENFADVVRGQAQPVMPLCQSVVNTYVIEALVKSMNERRPVDIQIPAEIAQATRESWRK